MTACSTSSWGKYLPGDWAGNRFDVDKIESVREGEGGEGWKDVTDDVVDLLAELW
ncbi:hypothetical protein BDN72DRAFT_834975 [Pluteus cervinus]|uniref:Uncharacterized protein n=1 Tax=Pluteus cervinus TaxID=181527 RepID=A0ACD3B6K9_9AGAR|nr:hypothetical protein BDN72DRAFT_834975 [Pluteus cervinus]